MEITHRFVSSKNDSSDASLVNPTDWNATHIIANPAVVSCKDFDFTPQAPGGSLTANISNTITLSPVPKGVNGFNSNYCLYIEDGDPEYVNITGGTAVSEAASGTIIFTPTKNHTGSFTVKSATAGILEAFKAGNNGIFVPAGSHNIYGPINFGTTSNLCLFGIPNASRLIAQSTLASGDNLISLTGSVTAIFTGASAYAFADRFFACNRSFDVTDSSGLVAGDYLWIASGAEATYSNVFTQILEVLSVVGNTVNFVDAMKIPFQVALSQALVYKVAFINNITISGLSIDMQDYGFAGIKIIYAKDSVIKDCYITRTVADGIQFRASLRCKLINIIATYCSNSGSYHDISFIYSTDCVGDNWLSEHAGFGVGIPQCTDCSISNIIAKRMTGRGLKTSGSAYCNIANVTAVGSLTASGIGITQGTYRCNFNNLIAYDNYAVGVWFSSQDNQYNNLNNVVALNNTQRGSGWDLIFFNGDINNCVRNVQAGNTSALCLVDVDGLNVVKPSSSPACRATLTANQTIANNTLTPLLFTSEIFDTAGIHSTSSNNERFNLPFGTIGLWKYDVKITFTAATTGIRSVYIQTEGSASIDHVDLPASSAANQTIVISGVYLSTWSGPRYLLVQVFQTSGGDLDIIAGESLTSMSLSMI